MNRTWAIAVLVVLVIAASAGSAYAALNFDGQTGVFLAPLAFTGPVSRVEVSTHSVNMDNLGTIATYNVSYGLRKNIEIGFTKIANGVSGLSDQNNLLLKWQFADEKPTQPAAAAWIVQRHLVTGDQNATDLGLSLTKCFTVAKRALVLNVGARSTKAVGLGLFGISPDRETKIEGAAAYFVTPKLAVATEFQQHIGIDTWTDLAVRYQATDKLNLDFGVANFNSALDNQVAFAGTYSVSF